MKRKSGFPARWAMLSTVPVTKLSIPTTLWPCLRSRSIRCEPRNPAAPVTTELDLDNFGAFLSGIEVSGDPSAETRSRLPLRVYPRHQGEFISLLFQR